MQQLPLQRRLELRQIMRDTDAKVAFEAACIQRAGVLDIIIDGEPLLGETFERGWESDGSPIKKHESAVVDALHTSWELSGYPHRRLGPSGELEIDEDAERAAERAAATRIGKRKTRCDCSMTQRMSRDWGCHCDDDHVPGCRCKICIDNDDWCF